METINEKKHSGESNQKSEKRSKSSSDTPPSIPTFGNKGEDMSAKFELPSLKIDK